MTHVMRHFMTLVEDELADLETSYRRLKAKRDQLNRDTDDLPYPTSRLDPHAPPSIRQVLVPDETVQRKRRYRSLMRDQMTNRIIEMNHELEILRARIRAGKRKGTPEELFVNYDSQKTKYERSYLHTIGQMIDEADGALPYPADRAITSFVGHAYSKTPEGGTPGFMAEEQLEDAYSAHPSEKGVQIRQQLDAAFAPIRDALRQQFGDTVTIHRAQSPLTGREKARNVLSWTSNLKFAESLLDTGQVLRDLLTKTVAVEDIVWITDRANQSEFIVRNHQTLGEGAQQSLPATPENIAVAKKFVFGKWRERAQELGRDDPLDLSDACKFTSLFASLVFGGTMRGNFFHQWVELPDGRPLDLNDEAADVITMLRGEIPDDAKPYADEMRKKLPPSLYTPDGRHMRSRGNRQSMASVRPRVRQWADEFLRGRMLGEAAEPIPDCVGPCLYHATFKRYVPAIMQHGLGATTSRKNFDVSRHGRVYLTNHPNVAENYAKEASHGDGEIVVLLVDQRQLDPALLHADENDTGVMLDMQYDDDGPSLWNDDEYDRSYISYEYHGVIPPSALSISHTI